MVPGHDDYDVTQKMSLATHMNSYKRKFAKEDRKKSSWYRIFFPNDADYRVKENPYAIYNKDDCYNPYNGYYSTYTNHFRDHEND